MSNLDMLDKVFASDTWFFVPDRRVWDKLCAWLDSERDSDSKTEDEVIQCREM